MTIPPLAVSAATGVQSTPTTPNAQVWKAAQDFEAMTIGQLLEPMFDTVDSSQGMFGGGAGETSFKPMLVTEMAKQVEQHGGLGLAGQIYQQMLKMQESRR